MHFDVFGLFASFARIKNCTCLSESDSKQYTNFEFCEEKKIISILKHVDLQSQEIYVDKNNLK
jgi:hypothetical protein